MESTLIVTALAALAHEGRLSVYRLLVTAGPEGLRVGQIAKKVNMPGATLSFHLSQLKHAGLVKAQRQGRELIQTADFDRMTTLISYLTENCCGGQSCAPICKPASAASGKAIRVATKRKVARG